MMMVPGADLRLGYDHQIKIGAEQIRILQSKVQDEIQCAKAENNENRPPVGGVFKRD